MTTAWGCDSEIVTDMVTVFGFIAHHSNYPDTLGYEQQFKAIVTEWRPELVD